MFGSRELACLKASRRLERLGLQREQRRDTTGSQVEIISNSPLIASLNSFLNMPLVGGMMRNSTTKVVKIQGYKSRLEKQGDNQNGKPNYQLQIPFKSALITITANGMDENAVMSFANSIPLDKITALIQ